MKLTKYQIHFKVNENETFKTFLDSVSRSSSVVWGKIISLEWEIYICVCVYKWVMIVAQSCLILCNPMDCSLPGSSVHGILQARLLEWVAISFSRGSSQPRDATLQESLYHLSQQGSLLLRDISSSVGKEPACQVREDPLEEGMATHSSNLAWRIPWTEEPDGLQSTGSQRLRQDWAANSTM